MADTIKRDKSGMWTEMPPSAKNRKPDIRQPIPAPVPENNNSNSKAEKKSDKKKADKKAVKQAKKKKDTRKQPAAYNRQERTDSKTARPDSCDSPMPSFLSENTRTDIPVVKPVDIQNRVLRNKPRSKSDRKEKKRRKRLSAYIVYYVIFGILAAVILAVLSTTVLFNLSKYRITGDTVYTEQQIIDAAGVNTGDNLILMDVGAVRQRLIDKLPYVDKVEVRRNIFTCALEINLNPATAIANVKKNNVYYLVSENGRIMNANLKTPDKKCVVVTGFDPEYASSGDFLSVTDEGSRNMLSKLLRAVKAYDGIDDEDEYEAQQKYENVFMLIGLCKDVGISEHITTIDITSIYSIKLTYDNKLTLELGDVTDAALKLTVAKNLIEKGEFDGEKGTLILSQLSENAYNMKVTFRPDYEDASSKDDTSKDDNTSGGDDSQTESVPETTAPSETETPPETEPPSESEPETEPPSETEPETLPETDSETEPQPETTTDTQPEPDPEPDTTPDTETESVTETSLDEYYE